jgi:putative holliday junction resolvase
MRSSCLAYRHCSMNFTLYNPSLADLSSWQPRRRVLALDVGKKRIGLAVSDELGITAQGLETLERSRVRDDLARLKLIAEHWSAGMLLVGRPLHMSGSESAQSAYTREFAERLGLYLALPVVYWDERLTTVEASRVLKEAGTTVAARKKAVDRLSAVLLLESYLGHRSAHAESTHGGTSA